MNSMKQGVKGAPEQGSEIGYVVGENTSDSFQFAVPSTISLKKWEYVSLDTEDGRVIGRIDRIISRSDLLNEGIGYESTKKYVDNRIYDEVSVCHARTLGIIRDGEIELSRRLIRPGTPVFRSSDTELRSLFGFSGEIGLHLGDLVDREDVPVMVNINGLRRHLSILAQTGAGKSNSAAVIIEELLKKGASIIVLDPHADYALMRKKRDGTHFSDYVKIFRTPFSTGRYGGDSVGIVSDFTIRFTDLEADDLCEIMDIKESWTNLRRIVDEMLLKPGSRANLSSFLSSVDELEADDRSKIVGRIRLLTRIKDMFGSQSTPLSEFLSPGQLTVLDLSGVDQYLANYFAYRVTSTVFEAKTTSEFTPPVFLVVEEAHIFVPPNSRWPISSLIKKIASEGRKFGMFLIVITQRPGKIDPDVLSQCNSSIIMRITNPLDQKAVLESGERISENIIRDLPSLNVGEAIITGEFTKTPCIIKVRLRETMEGGGDIDLVGELERSREERDKKYNVEDNRKHISDLMEGL